MYASRDENGKINGLFARKQNEESEIVSEDDAEILAFLNPPPTVDELRKADYKAKGWNNPWDLIDDILNRGDAIVKAERDAIKAKHPKG